MQTVQQMRTEIAASMKKKLEWSFKIKIDGILAKLEQKSQVLHAQLLCRHGQWHLQGYLVQLQIESPIIAQKIQKTQRYSLNNDFN